MAKQTKNEFVSGEEMYLNGTISARNDSNKEETIIDVPVLIQEIEQKRRKGCKEFTFYVNSDGGQCIQGQTLFSYLQRNKFNVTWVVDGIAASMMAAIISDPSHKVIANAYSKFMYHRVQGSVYGNADDCRNYATMLDKFEGSIYDMLARRMKITTQEARTKFCDGRDHWLTAQEAMNLGLCDEIIPSDISIPDTITDSKAIFDYCQNHIINQKSSEMLKETKKFADALNMAETTDEDVVLTRVQAVVNERNAAQSELAAEKAKNLTLSQQVANYQKQKVTNLINAAVEAKKIGEDERATYTKLAEANFEDVEAILAKRQGVDKVVDKLDGNVIPEAEKAWGWDEYHKAGKLENLKATNKAHFDELYKAKFNTNPKN
ncbi:MAG: ATP-dependent Clp protease proteolytic subunit [Bacteroidales bacterium]|jgi:ATP-dependent protease ClpP protease subunit|nr:ATP-dependent Clp protease proteolytic subunit [Bacteroidales bacterium]